MPSHKKTANGTKLGVISGGKITPVTVSPFIQQVRNEARRQLQDRISTIQALAAEEAARLVADLQQQRQGGMDRFLASSHVNLPKLSGSDLTHRITLRTAFTDTLEKCLCNHGMMLEQVADPSAPTHGQWFAKYKA